MEIEFLKFYEVSRDDSRGHLSGTLHIRLPSIGLNLKGIQVIRKKNYFFISLPSKKGFDKSQNKEVNYMLVLFDEQGKNEALLRTLKEKGRIFVEDYLKKTPQISPQVQKSGLGRATSSMVPNSAPAPRQTASATKQKIWVDPPKRQAPFKRGGAGQRR